MKKILLLKIFLLATVFSFANTILVKNIDELNKANKNAKAGDIICLQNGIWNNVFINLNCNGTKEKPISFKAQTEGKVIITGYSQLKLGGNYIIVDGLYFTKGYSGDSPVIEYRIDKNQIANNCRITNTVINDFNNIKRNDENYWIAFYGKNNRMDHCSFKDKKNMGVLLAVILDDERSRENFHSIDHNYFGRRPALASNTGEMLRVGVSQHCQFNSNTQITENFFEHCDGETEIISIKSGSNIVKGNVFKESQGSVVLRHGDDNTVINNIFLGNGKKGTGGVRVINKGQWVINNFFYQCRGESFRSPLSIMNGIPNSPANRYVQVTDAVIANNTFFDCAPFSMCEGSDTERSLAPDNVKLFNNIFYNHKDSIIYNVFDDTKGFEFFGNEVSTNVRQTLFKGFTKTNFTTQINDNITLPKTVSKSFTAVPDSLQKLAMVRIQHQLPNTNGFSDLEYVNKSLVNAYTNTGSKWFKSLNKKTEAASIAVSCNTTEEVYKALARPEPVSITLTGKSYFFNQPLLISKSVKMSGTKNLDISFSSASILSVFLIAGNGNLSLDNLSINGKEVKARNFISSDSTGVSNHYNFKVQGSTFQNFNRENGCENLFYAYKYMAADSVIFRNNAFINNNSNTIMMAEEKDDKGYYNAEKIVISNNRFDNLNGVLLNIYRGGNDESTLGPDLLFSQNLVSDCNTKDQSSLIDLTGVQQTNFSNNNFSKSNAGKTLFLYKDIVRSTHKLENNIFNGSGKIQKNGFVTEKNNVIK